MVQRHQVFPGMFTNVQIGLVSLLPFEGVCTDAGTGVPTAEGKVNRLPAYVPSAKATKSSIPNILLPYIFPQERRKGSKRCFMGKRMRVWSGKLEMSL